MDVTEIVVDDGLNEPDFTGFDLSGFSKLKRLEIGNDCFAYVEEVKLIGLKQLESVEIGENSFTKNERGDGYDPDGHFYSKDCPKLKSSKMGRYSFSDYTVIEIENVDALEEIEFGGFAFYYDSLELRSTLFFTVRNE